MVSFSIAELVPAPPFFPGTNQNSFHPTNTRDFEQIGGSLRHSPADRVFVGNTCIVLVWRAVAESGTGSQQYGEQT